MKTKQPKPSTPRICALCPSKLTPRQKRFCAPCSAAEKEARGRIDARTYYEKHKR